MARQKYLNNGINTIWHQSAQKIDQALAFDRLNGNKAWQEAIDKEMDSLNVLNVFNYKSPNYKPGDDFQYAPLRMVFNVKQDLHLKARLVIGDHIIGASHLQTYSSVVKEISIRLLQIVADHYKLN